MPTLYVEGNTKIPTTSHNENQKVQVIEKDLRGSKLVTNLEIILKND